MRIKAWITAASKTQVLTAFLMFATLLSACQKQEGIQSTQVATSTPTPTAAPTATPFPFPTIPLPELPFYTIEQAPSPGRLPPDLNPKAFGTEYYSEKNAMIYVITGADDPLLDENKWISLYAKEYAPAKIRATDFSKYFVLIAFQGYRGHGHTGIEIKNIYVTGGGIVAVVAQFTEGPPGAALEQMVSSPYHAVAVSKEGMTRLGDTDFELYDQIYTFRAWTKHRVS